MPPYGRASCPRAVGAAPLHWAMAQPGSRAALGPSNHLQADDPIYITEHWALGFLSFPVHSPVLLRGCGGPGCLCSHSGFLLCTQSPSQGSRQAGQLEQGPSLGKCALVIALNCWFQTSSLFSKDTFYKFANLHVAKIPLWFI